MASVNLETGKISGCTKSSKTYYHEVGHLKFEEEHPRGIQVRIIQNLSLRVLLFSIGLYCIYPLAFMKSVIFASILSSILSEMWEEAWCWNYAKLQLKAKVINENTKTKTS
jgi:hypothetical protein